MKINPKKTTKHTVSAAKKRKPLKLILTKGKLSKVTGSSTSGTTPVPVSIPITPLSIFQRSIDRAENLFGVERELQKTTKADRRSLVADAHRAAVVLAVAALDAFVRTFVVDEVIAKINDLKQPVPAKLREQAKTFLGHDALFDAARSGDLSSRLEKEFRDNFEEKSFQGVTNIAEVMKLIGHEDIFHVIACSASVNEDHLKRDLGRFTKRRHIVAHCGDYDMTQTPPIENFITSADVQRCIETVKLVAAEINKLKK